MSFGLNPATVFNETIYVPGTLWWGIRAIWSRRVIDIVHDRQQFSDYTDEQSAERIAICQWFAKKGCKLLDKALEVTDGTKNTLVHVTDGRFHAAANPQASYGYLYIGVWKDAAS